MINNLTIKYIRSLIIKIMVISNNHNKQYWPLAIITINKKCPHIILKCIRELTQLQTSVTSMLRMKRNISTNACIKGPGVLDFPRCIAYSSRDLYYQQPCTPKDLESRDLYSLLCDILP
jgi:hypothetical protein